MKYIDDTSDDRLVLTVHKEIIWLHNRKMSCPIRLTKPWMPLQRIYVMCVQIHGKVYCYLSMKWKSDIIYCFIFTRIMAVTMQIKGKIETHTGFFFFLVNICYTMCGPSKDYTEEKKLVTKGCIVYIYEIGLLIKKVTHLLRANNNFYICFFFLAVKLCERI